MEDRCQTGGIMSNSETHLLAFAITPVQRFIREARKAQDLWSGSLLLSHMALAALKHLRAGDPDRPEMVLISPSPDALDAPTPEERIRPRVTNEAVALVHGDEDATRE